MTEWIKIRDNIFSRMSTVTIKAFRERLKNSQNHKI